MTRLWLCIRWLMMSGEINAFWKLIMFATSNNFFVVLFHVHRDDVFSSQDIQVRHGCYAHTVHFLVWPH